MSKRELQDEPLAKTVPTSPPLADEDEESSPRPLTRSGKGILSREFYEQEGIEELPELGDYFDRFTERPLDAYERIKICRAYASYLVTTIREPPVKKSKK